MTIKVKACKECGNKAKYVDFSRGPTTGCHKFVCVKCCIDGPSGFTALDAGSCGMSLMVAMKTQRSK